MLFSEWKKEYLSESLSKIVYHGTNINNLLSILESDVFWMTPISNKSDNLQNKFYYFSVSRVKYGGFMMSTNPNVNIVLDGQKLAYKYKGISVDYWGDKFSDKSVKNKLLNTYYRNKSDENEERIITDEDEIKNAHQYIKEIHVLTKYNDTNFYETDKNIQFKKLKEISKYCREYNIPCYFYYKSQENEFKVLRQKNNELTKIFRSEYKEYIKGVIKLFNDRDKIKTLSEIDKDEYGFNYTTLALYTHDMITSINNFIHNNKNDKFDRRIIKKYFDILRKTGVKSTKEFLEKLINYFEDLPKYEEE